MRSDRDHPSEDSASSGPNWIPLRVVMQKYCEPYFAAASRWCHYRDPELVQNRAQLIETAKRIFEEYSFRSETHAFELLAEDPSAPLLAEVSPSQGSDYRPGADQLARTAALNAKYVPVEFFNRVGIFFQKNLLKELAGWSDEKLLAANHDTRRSITAAVDLLLRLPESAGKAQFVLCEAEGERKRHVFPSSPLSEKGHAFVSALLLCASSAPPAAPAPVSTPALAPASASPSKRESERETNGDNAGEGERYWLTAHASVGKALLRRDGVEGRTIRYLPPSERHLRDQRYCVRWADGSETEIGANEYELMRRFLLRNKPEHSLQSPSRSHPLERANGQTSEKKERKKEKESKSEGGGEARAEDTRAWTSEHKSVGVSVAISRSTKSKGKKEKKIIRGEVVRYSPRSSESARDELFRVRWEDADEQDLDEEDLVAAASLFAEHFDEPQWTSEHAAVGIQVAAFFTVARKRKLFFGEISRYAPPSCAVVKNQLYHVQWEDGDEQDLDEDEFQAGKVLAMENDSQDNKEMKKAETDTETDANVNADMEAEQTEINQEEVEEVKEMNTEAVVEPSGAEAEADARGDVKETKNGNEVAEESQPLSSTSSAPSSSSSSQEAMELCEREESSAVANHSEAVVEEEHIAAVGSNNVVCEGAVSSVSQNEEKEAACKVPESESATARDKENGYDDFAPHFEELGEFEKTSMVVLEERQEEEKEASFKAEMTEEGSSALAENGDCMMEQ